MTNDASADGSRHVVTALFADDASAERAYAACLKRGYEIGDVNVVMSDDTRQRLIADQSEITSEMAQRKAEGGELGGPTGGRIGILISVVAAVGAALALPALGVVMAGPVAVALAGAGAAGLAAGLVGVFGDWGLPEERVREYEAGIKNGGILMGVEARSANDAREIEREWTAFGARHLRVATLAATTGA